MLTVSSIAHVAELAAAGVPLLQGKKLGADGNWQSWIEDPDGYSHRTHANDAAVDASASHCAHDRDA